MSHCFEYEQTPAASKSSTAQHLCEGHLKTQVKTAEDSQGSASATRERRPVRSSRNRAFSSQRRSSLELAHPLLSVSQPNFFLLPTEALSLSVHKDRRPKSRDRDETSLFYADSKSRLSRAVTLFLKTYVIK